MNPRLLKQCAAEFIGTFTLIFVGVGAIANSAPGFGMGHLVYWMGPLIGGAFAGVIYGRFLIKESLQT